MQNSWKQSIFINGGRYYNGIRVSILKKKTTLGNTWFSLLQIRSSSWFLASAQKVDAVVRVVYTLSLFKVEGLPFNLEI